MALTLTKNLSSYRTLTGISKFSPVAKHRFSVKSLFRSLGFLTCKVGVGTDQTDFQPSLCSGGVDWLLLPMAEIERNSEKTGWASVIEVYGVRLWLEGRTLSAF